MICPISSYLSLSLLKFNHHLRTRSFVTLFCFSMLWSSVVTVYIIQRVLHHRRIDRLPLSASLSSPCWPSCTQLPTFPNSEVTNQYSLHSHPSSHLRYRHQIDCLHLLLQSRLMMKSKCIAKLPWLCPQCASANSVDHGLQVHPQPHSLTIWWISGAWWQTACHQHCAALCMASEGNSSERAVLSRDL